ncbi:hypothetical protein PTE_01170, partial [Photorhabdus khanii NC19]
AVYGGEQSRQFGCSYIHIGFSCEENKPFILLNIWIDPWGLTGKPLNSPDIVKWSNKGGIVWQEIDT